MKAVNLLPPDARGANKAAAERTVVVDHASSSGAYLLLGVLALAVLAVAGVVLTGNAIKDREAQLASAEAQKAQIAVRAAQLKPYADFDQLASERLATVNDLAGQRFDWEQVTPRPLARHPRRRHPLRAQRQRLHGRRRSSSGLRSAIAAPAITISGCTDNQREVAGLMSRLRNIDGVTRVSLSKSTKSEADAAVGLGAEVPVGTTMADRRAKPCGSGRKPMFEMIMFFEGDVKASTGPSATQSAAGAPTAATPTPTPAAGTGTAAPATATPTPAATTTSGGVSP